MLFLKDVLPLKYRMQKKRINHRPMSPQHLIKRDLLLVVGENFLIILFICSLDIGP